MFLLAVRTAGDGHSGVSEGYILPDRSPLPLERPSPPPGPNETQLVMGITHIRSLKRKGILNIFKTVKTQQTS